MGVDNAYVFNGVNMLIEKKVNPIRVICESRRLKAQMALTKAEFYFVASNQELNSDDKIIWLMLAAQSASNPELNCILSYQHLAELVAQSSNAVSNAVLRLNKMGYLVCKEEWQDTVRYQINLPLQGLLTLKKDPKVRDFNHREYIQQLRCGNDPALSDVLNTFPVNHHDYSVNQNGETPDTAVSGHKQKSVDKFCACLSSS